LIYLPACLPLGATPFFSGAATFLGSSFGAASFSFPLVTASAFLFPYAPAILDDFYTQANSTELV